ncbi:heavy metal-associated isoprenylated plant protein 19 [Juglans microcarpa x Juglans regia]|uniref:heavy metal-associated isoprenylated plant protein 19 n=1 Tax=Juglans microcarpa x Juglans regia TaxID=2249226 RepID=UPI001B7F52BB|nr:heavy metal-associated isoprenylated plant protein 19 [Juglans microcarpa x Juglans regia]
MAKKKKKDVEATKEVVHAEFKVSMHCNACERTVAKAISKCKGVEKFTTDMNNHKVVATGKFDPQKVLKKLKKKTGKRAEIVVNKEKAPASSTAESNGSELSVQPKVAPDDPLLIMFDYCKENELLMMFSDENPNACTIM